MAFCFETQIGVEKCLRSERIVMNVVVHYVILKMLRIIRYLALTVLEV
jgi:hypothetical protein